MSTLARTASGDIAIPLAIETDLSTLTARKVQDEFGLWQGEWFLDVTIGFPWLQKVLGIRNPNLGQIRALLRQAILLTPGIQSVQDLQISLDPKTRDLIYAFVATIDTGATLTGGTGQPFVVTGSAS